MGVGANSFDIAAHRDQTIRGADKTFAQPLHHGLHTPILPQE